MAIGDTVQAGLMRVDSSPILLAGQAQAKANQAFGNAVGGVVEKFYQKKKDKQERDEREQAYLKMGLSSEEAKAASRDKDLANQFINKMNADRNFLLAQQEFLIEKEKEKTAADLLDLRKKDYENRFQERKRLLKEAKELKESQLKLDRFLTERPKTETPEFSNLQKQFTLDQIPGTPEFKAKELSEPMGARPPLMASVATSKPNFKMFNVGQSEAVARLPESFQPEGKRVIDAVESGRLTPGEGMSLINRIQAQAMAEQKDAPKPMTPMELAELKELDLANRKAEFELSDLETPKTIYEAGPTIVEDNIFRALDIIKKSPKTTTGMGSYLSNIPGTDAKSLKERLGSIKANIGFDYLQAMREASPTGGALGNVSDKELQGLQSVFGSLEQSLDAEELTYNLNLLNYTYNNVIHGEGNHNVLDPRKGGNSPQQSANTIDPSAPASQATLDELEKKRQLRSKRAGL